MPEALQRLRNFALNPVGSVLNQQQNFMNQIDMWNDNLARLTYQGNHKVGKPPDYVERGYIAIAGSAMNEGIEFQINPDGIDRDKEARYRTIHSPGLSHSILQYIDGGKDDISITIVLDAHDPQYCNWKPKVNPPVARAGLAGLTKIELQIGWLRAQTVAIQNRVGVLAGPPKLLLVFGAWFTEVRIIKVRDKKNRFDPDLNVTRTEITLDMTRVIDRHQNPEDIMREF